MEKSLLAYISPPHCSNSVTFALAWRLTPRFLCWKSNFASACQSDVQP